MRTKSYVMTPMNGWKCCLDDMGLCYGPGLRDGDDVWMTCGYYVTGPD